MRGACVSWCALFTQRQPPSMRQERANVAFFLSLFLSDFFTLTLSFSLFFSLSLAYCVSLSRLHPLNIGVDKPPALWDPSSDPSQSGYRMTILL